MIKNAKALKATLSSAGFSQSAIKAAWPEWWSDDADTSTSAQNELRFSLARKLGLDPRSLLDGDAPKFVWTDRTKYKRLAAETEFEQEALASFGTGVARSLIAGSQAVLGSYDLSAKSLRAAILKHQKYVRLPDLIGTCWSLGIPVGYLRVFPLPAKRMAAMTVSVDGRYAILLSQEARFPAPVAYYVAHELGHIVLGHLQGQSALVDVGDPLRSNARGGDTEEESADKYALELLTGQPDPMVTTTAHSFLARQLAETAIRSADELAIEPGTLALCFGHSTGRWNKAYGALKYIYGDGAPVWQAINEVLRDSLDWSLLTAEMSSYLGLVFDVKLYA